MFLSSRTGSSKRSVQREVAPFRIRDMEKGVTFLRPAGLAWIQNMARARN